MSFQFDSVSQVIQGSKALGEVGLKAHGRELLALVDPSRSGKITLLMTPSASVSQYVSAFASSPQECTI